MLEEACHVLVQEQHPFERLEVPCDALRELFKVSTPPAPRIPGPS